MNKLRQNNKIIIKPPNKDLGPVVMDTETYVKQILQEHLTTKHYLQLSNTESHNCFKNIEKTLKDIISSNLDSLSKSEAIYFQEAWYNNIGSPFLWLTKSAKEP